MSKKVFELAKELGMKPLDLVDHLKGAGHAVRNHMSVLSNEVITQIKADLAPPEKSQGKKKTVKKASKRPAKKSSKKVVTVEGKTTEAEDKPKKKVSATGKKKAVIRRRVKKAAPATSAAPESPKAAKSVAKQETEVKKDQPVLVEKTHKFTPVYTPKKEETPSTPAEGEGKKSEKELKRRLGGLASMISTKKGLGRSQTLRERRSEEELKSYASLSGSGRPIYTTIKRRKQYTGPVKSTELTELKESKRILKLHGGSSALELAKKLKIKFKELVDKCLELNLLIKQEDFLGMDLAAEVAALYDHRVENVAFQEEEVLGTKEVSEEELEKLPPRNPVVAIMGHVDHGKTTLLDTIRDSKVAAAEAGGITQHIGAYLVSTKEGKSLTFLDTPGHNAFSSMRQRGANVTDIVILVVAADDGVMPQTRESIRHIENAKVPMVVAINKMDKEDANADRIKQELAELNVTPEDWGGDVQMVPVSALNGEGVDELLEATALQAEMLQLRADTKSSACGVVVEAKIEAGRGPVATILVQTGTLNKGDNIVVGETYGRARSLSDHTGAQLKSAGPSIPVQMLGLSTTPAPGDLFNVVKNEREAKRIAQNRIEERKKLHALPDKPGQVSLEDFFAQAMDSQEKVKELNVIVRADTQGSCEAIVQSLSALSNAEVAVKMVAEGIGQITDNDVNLAAEARAIVFGFNIRPATSARQLAEKRGVDVKTYTIIYELIRDVELALEGMLVPAHVENYIGRAEVKETFTVPKAGVIAGSIVIDGAVKAGHKVRLLRQGKILFDGQLSSLRRFKDDVKEVKTGLECGIGLENYNDIKIGDLFEIYGLEERKRTLEEPAAKVEPKAPEAASASEGGGLA